MDIQKERQCLGRNRSWRRCGRYVVGKRFCADHSWQPWIFLFVLIFTIIPAGITIKTCFWTKKSGTIYNISRDAIFHNSSNKILPDVNESFGSVRDAKTDEVTFRVYNPASGEMEKVEPKEGKIYEIKTRTGAKINYMVEDGKVYTDYTSPDGNRKSYYVSDLQGTLLDQKFPHKLEEYTVVIPSELELRRFERPLPNGWKFVHVDLKWDGKVEMTLDPLGKLQWVKIEGGCRTNHKLKTLIAGRIEKTSKWMLPNNLDAGDDK